MAPELALKIAAGEVVERPASAVKELIDNAIDAGATRIEIDVREAGLKLIRVTDDGCGIPREELPLAFASHATSKVETLDDLDHLTTLGFRGEALPSIAAVARVDVQTRAADETAGSRLQVEFGDSLALAPAAVPGGFRIAVADLFANVPARRKFVRSLRAEAGQIGSVVAQYALAQPGIAFALRIDERLVLETAGSGHLADALAAVYGPGVVADTCAVEGRSEDVAVVGLASLPRLSRSNRAAIHIAVNGRPIANRSLAFALEEAYSGYLMTGRHPLAAMHLSLPPGEVDANIHPAKQEIRFSREREVHGLLHRAVASALLSARLTERDMAVSPVAASPPAPAEAVALGLEYVDEEPQDAPAVPTLVPALPGLRIVGQTGQTFIIAEGPQGLYMIDQHAAHERIIFDRLETELEEGTVAAQPLLAPATIELEPAQMAALESNAELLRRVGFEIEPFGDTACLIRAVPALSGRSSPAELTREVLTELESLPQPAAARERALAAMACRAAVKAGQTLDLDEMRELVLQLERTPRPATCPHGRPTMIHLSHTQLEREFGRR
jgi:DNA mismatch repair protein MutL